MEYLFWIPLLTGAGVAMYLPYIIVAVVVVLGLLNLGMHFYMKADDKRALEDFKKEHNGMTPEEYEAKLRRIRDKNAEKARDRRDKMFRL